MWSIAAMPSLGGADKVSDANGGANDVRVISTSGQPPQPQLPRGTHFPLHFSTTNPMAG